MKYGRRRSQTTCGRVDTVVPGVERAPNPSCVSRVRNMETPSGSDIATGLRPADAGKPTVRGAQIPGGNRMPKKRMPVAERPQETRALWSLLQAAVLDNLPDTKPCALAAKAG